MKRRPKPTELEELIEEKFYRILVDDETLSERVNWRHLETGDRYVLHSQLVADPTFVEVWEILDTLHKGFMYARIAGDLEMVSDNKFKYRK